MNKHIQYGMKAAVAVAIGASTVGAFGSGTVSATHTHSMMTGNGSCVLLARNGGEGEVELPHADGVMRHPLHVNVHLGAPGRSGEIGVQGREGSDPCLGGDYLND